MKKAGLKKAATGLPPPPKRVGLALGSGSARGWSHIGVIKGLQEAGVNVELVCGTSMGAMVAGAFAAGFIDVLDEWVRGLTWPDILGFMDVRLPRSGLIEGDKLTRYFRENISDSHIEDLPMPYAAVSTELKTGREVWIRSGSLMDAIRASMSMPGILTPFPGEGGWCVDGGLVNPVPVSLCRSMGADIVIAVDLNSDIMGRSFNRPDNRREAAPPPAGNGPYLPSRLASFFNGKIKTGQMSIFKRFAQNQPSRGPTLFEVIATSVYIMQDQITRHRLAADPPDVLIRPRLAHIGLLEFNRAAEAIEEGRKAVQLMLPILADILRGS
ncbi:MAG TPA: patatin-like phospholipase family protein [Syntrophales bacterium]|jgi:NTE family protein|nr:patatin-like phospholipase family protein [Syntrophales bacterium]HQI35209.1 patatin-like phospholipase family protein [Syntrophales bacterium]HRR46665.1 patatin-like phospholipase family protein [Syntrophales bacterium]